MRTNRLLTSLIGVGQGESVVEQFGGDDRLRPLSVAEAGVADQADLALRAGPGGVSVLARGDLDKAAGPARSFGPPPEPITATRYDLQVTGASDNRIDVWFVGDGYTEGQLDLLLEDVTKQWEWMTTEALAEPFAAYADLFNVHVVFAPSAEAGADRPDEGLYVETAFGASYSWGGADARTLYLDAFAADDAIARVLGDADVDLRFGIVNDVGYGGAGDAYAVFAAGAERAREIALHEAGHSFAGLGDEYWEDGSGAFAGTAPDAPNLATDPSDVPWAHWIGYDDGVLGPIGAYEGGLYAETGIFRPTEDSGMRTLGQPFDAVAREQFVLGFHDAFDPLDAWAFEGEGALVDVYDPFWATAAGDVVALEWSVDGVVVGTDAMLDIAALDLGPGTFEVALRAFDDSPYVRQGRDALEQSVVWDLTLNFRAGRGTDADDDFEGTTDADRFDGLDGADQLAGGDGADLLLGGAGDDVLYGDQMDGLT